MDASIEEIKTDILAVIDKLDRFKAGNDIETGFLIERGEDILNNFIRYDLDVIEKAAKI
jgi:repressor of nif and glnA expression